MANRRGRFAEMVVVLVAARVGWWVWEVVFRHYGSGTVTGPLLLNATPEAAAAAAITWLVSTAVLALLGLLVVRRLRRAVA